MVIVRTIKGSDPNPSAGLTSLGVAEGPSDGPPHPHLAVRQVLQLQLPDGDGPAAELVADWLVVQRHRAGDDQDVLEQKHVQLLGTTGQKQKDVRFYNSWRNKKQHVCRSVCAVCLTCERFTNFTP